MSAKARTPSEEQDEEGPRCRVLVVDDHEINRRLMLRYLERLGHLSSFARNGQDALNVLRTETVNIVLMDVHMPVMDGLEATRRIRLGECGCLVREIPVIAVTANGADDNRRDCLEAGMQDFLQKPISLAVLRQTIEEHAVAGV